MIGAMLYFTLRSHTLSSKDALSFTLVHSNLVNASSQIAILEISYTFGTLGHSFGGGPEGCRHLSLSLQFAIVPRSYQMFQLRRGMYKWLSLVWIF
jgi:hypothetical protein